MSAPLALPKGSLILVTGCNGFLGSHITDQIIIAGYRVRGTVRSLERATWLKEVISKKHGEGVFEAVVVKDMADDHAFDHVMDGVSGVIHSASDLTFSPNPDDVIPGVVRGAENVLKAAAAHPSIKRFVYTSSSSATSITRPGKKQHLTDKTWNDEAVELVKVDPNSGAAKDPLMGLYVYCASKTLGERKCWEFVKEQKPGFVLNAVLPNFNIGLILHKDQPTSSAGMIRGVWANNKEAIQRLEGLGPQYWVDVQDIGRLHVAALIYDDIKDERLMGFTAPLSYNATVAMMKTIDPSRPLPAENPDEAVNGITVDTEKTEAYLTRFGRKGWTSFDESLRNTLVQF